MPKGSIISPTVTDPERHQDYPSCGAPMIEVVGRRTVLHGDTASMAEAIKRPRVVFEFRTNEAANALCHFQDYQEVAGI